MVNIKPKKVKINIVLVILALCICFILASCENSNSSTPDPVITDESPSISIQPSLPPVAEESDFIELDMIMQYQHGIQVMPVIYDTSSVTLKASDGYEVRLDILDNGNLKYPIYNSRQNETLNSSLIAVPGTEGNQYILCNQHKIYLVNLSNSSMDILLAEEDDDTTYLNSLENNQANGLYWGTKPVISEDGQYLLYLTNRRNNGKTNDIRLYNFESKEDILLLKDAYYNHAYISETTVFYTCNDMLMRIEISSKAKASVSYSVSPNGCFSYPYYIYTPEYYQKYEILNLLTLNIEKGSLGSENSALKILTLRTDTSNTAAVLLLNQQKVTLSFIDMRLNKLLKTFVLSDSFKIVYTQWVDNNTFLVSGYEGGINEKTYLLSY